MDIFMESIDMNPIKVDIYEKFHNGLITESERDTLLTEATNHETQLYLIEEATLNSLATMMKLAGVVAGAIAAAGGISVLVMKTISMLKVKNKIKASNELTTINSDLKKCANDLRKARGELQEIISKYRTLASDASTRSNFYGSRVTSSPTTTIYSDGYVGTGTTTTYNPQYDPDKSKEEAEKAEKLREVVSKYIAKRDEIKGLLKQLKSLKSKFLAMVRANAAPDEYQSIKEEIDKIMASIPDTTDEDA